MFSGTPCSYMMLGELDKTRFHTAKLLQMARVPCSISANCSKVPQSQCVSKCQCRRSTPLALIQQLDPTRPPTPTQPVSKKPVPSLKHQSNSSNQPRSWPHYKLSPYHPLNQSNKSLKQSNKSRNQINMSLRRVTRAWTRTTIRTLLERTSTWFVPRRRNHILILYVLYVIF